jgi:hypothetical protein
MIRTAHSARQTGAAAVASESTITLFAGLPWEAWTAVGTFVIAVGTLATWWLGRRVGEAQERIKESRADVFLPVRNAERPKSRS